MTKDDTMSASKMFEKVLELQKEVAKVRAEKEELVAKQDREASLERRLIASKKEVAELKKKLHDNGHTIYELSKIRALLAVAFDLHKGDGWPGWRDDR